MDLLIYAVDRALRTLHGSYQATRATPLPSGETVLTDAERQCALELMRVNHAGEVAAQALYQGQALFSRDTLVRAKLDAAADEEIDHLQWTRSRIESLGGRTSLLDPLWYSGAFMIGAVAGAIGDRVSLGFLEATETQVEAHLASHLDRLPANDAASRTIVEQMKRDEASHADTARQLGAKTLPLPVLALMRLSSKVMTSVAAKI